ncbi:MAG: cation-transporting P-type ATPase [Chloroflexia bacterium]|nr:cation-transporting P-type ATPase [Chloroflexia bacterium]
MSERSLPVNQTWTSSPSEVLDALSVSPDEGLDPSRVREQRRRYGKNRLRDTQAKSAWQILLEQFKSFIVVLLVVAALLSFLFGQWVEGAAVVAVILINATIGFVTELRAVRSMEALQRLGNVGAKVRREGQVQEIAAEKLVPGDIVILDAGDVVTADLRLIEASKLQADESALTGESVPVSKAIETLEQDTPLAERSNMLFKGTAVTRGSAEGMVVATGMDTELGHISTLVEEAEQEITPLEKRLDQLGHWLVWVTLGIAGLVAVSGLLVGKEPLLIIETSIALAVATVPEGLPIVATVALARGMWRMARRNALINRLSAVETLGVTTVICTDKTGTLTENQMTVTRLVLDSGDVDVGGEGLRISGAFRRDGQELDPSDEPVLREALRVGVLCNNASLERPQNGQRAEAVGEPMEVALLVLGAKAGLEREQLLDSLPEEREVAFDPESKRMATVHRAEEGYRVAVKGAPQAVLEISSRVRTPDGPEPLGEEGRQAWSERNDQLAAEGFRVLALAGKTMENAEDDPYEQLTLLGLLAFIDPPREEVAPSLQACREAGVRVVMVTGDHPVTARKVAQAVGLVQDDEASVVRGEELAGLEGQSGEARQRILDAAILARVSPKQKLDLIDLHQAQGDIVAMTGDGVNDAPALKKADIGVAMGQRGTQVAREAADMVLRDDAFGSIVAAIEQGRVILDNIRKFVLYLVSCNTSEVLIVGLASLVNAPLPIKPLQILFLNLVTDVFPALALGLGRGDPSMMQRPPRDPQEPILTRHHWFSIAGYGALITGAVLGAFALALRWLKLGTADAVTVSFLALAFAQLWHVFNMRVRGSGLLNNDVTRNPYVWGALLLCVGLLLGAVYIPPLADLLKISRPGGPAWLLILGASLLPLILGQVYTFVRFDLLS